MVASTTSLPNPNHSFTSLLYVVILDSKFHEASRSKNVSLVNSLLDLIYYLDDHRSHAYDEIRRDEITIPMLMMRSAVDIVALALEYLHHGHFFPTVHCDV